MMYLDTFVWCDATFHHGEPQDGRNGAIGIVALVDNILHYHGFPILARNQLKAERIGTAKAREMYPTATIYNDVLNDCLSKKIVTEHQWVSRKDIMMKAAHRLAAYTYKCNHPIHYCIKVYDLI